MTQANIELFQSIREKTLKVLLDGRQTGLKVVGLYCTYAPQELVLAANAIPIGLCGTKEDPIPAAEEVLPRNLCPLIKSSYGFAATDTCPFFHFSNLVIGETTCDGKKKMFEIMQDIKPVHVMQLPHVGNANQTMDMWVAEIRRLKARLEQELDVTITDEQIWDAIDIINEETRLVKEMHDLNQQNPPLLPGMKLLIASWSRSFATSKQDVIATIKDVIATAKADAPTERSNRPRILLTGCPVGLGSEKVVRLLDELNADMVAMENCSGYKTLELQASKQHADPIVALAEKYLKIPCSCMSPNPYRMEMLERMIEDFQVDGVIDLTWQACHTYNIEANAVGKLVKSKGLPYLHLESDYSQSDIETLKVRIEAMLEMVV